MRTANDGIARSFVKIKIPRIAHFHESLFKVWQEK